MLALSSLAILERSHPRRIFFFTASRDQRCECIPPTWLCVKPFFSFFFLFFFFFSFRSFCFVLSFFRKEREKSILSRLQQQLEVDYELNNMSTVMDDDFSVDLIVQNFQASIRNQASILVRRSLANINDLVVGYDFLYEKVNEMKDVILLSPSSFTMPSSKYQDLSDSLNKELDLVEERNTFLGLLAGRLDLLEQKKDAFFRQTENLHCPRGSANGPRSRELSQEQLREFSTEGQQLVAEIDEILMHVLRDEEMMTLHPLLKVAEGLQETRLESEKVIQRVHSAINSIASEAQGLLI